MSKRIILILWIIAATSDFSLGTAISPTLSRQRIELGAQGNTKGNYLDIVSSQKYTSRETADYSDRIHLMYVFGKNSGANLFIPGSRGIRRYSNAVFEQISEWPHRHEGQMINLGNTQQMFDDLSSAQDIKRNYVKHRSTIYHESGYKMSTSGPEDALNALKVGDVIIMHIYEKNLYVALSIQHIVPGAKGSITFDIKWGTVDTGEGSENLKAEPDLGEKWEIGTVYADEKYWNEYLVGDMPLILSVPHGGAMNPLDLPDRDCPNAVLGTDMLTIELARELQNVFLKEYGMRPHVVVCNLSRRKVDQNRGLETGTCGNEPTKIAWQKYHDYIDTAIVLAGKNHERIFFLDIHAHAHTIQRLELGYLINGQELAEVYREYRLAEMARRSSVSNIIPQDSTHLLSEHLFGKNALGTMAENRGIKAIPSQQDPYPGEGERYLSRGYNTERYTSAAYPNVYGVQLECNRIGVRDDEGRPKFAKEFVDIIIAYMKVNRTL